MLEGTPLVECGAGTGSLPGSWVCFAVFGARSHWGAASYRVPEASSSR